MPQEFVEIRPEEITDNPFKLLGQDWTLITAGQPDQFNSMTASWGGLGVLWQKPVATIYVRPQRYTREFLDREDFYSLCFFGPEHRAALSTCGATSGRDTDKVRATGLTPVTDASGATYYAEARLVLILRKLYVHDLDPAKVSNIDIAPLYAEQDYHRMFIGEVVKALRKD